MVAKMPSCRQLFLGVSIHATPTGGARYRSCIRAPPLSPASFGGRRVTPRVIELVGQARRELAYGASRTQLRLRHREGAQDDVPGRAGEARSARAGRVDGHRAAQAPAPVTRQRRDGAVGEAHGAGPPRCSGNSLSTRSGLEPVGEGRERGYKFRALDRSYSSVWAPMANDEKPSEKIKGKEALRGVGFTM